MQPDKDIAPCIDCRVQLVDNLDYYICVSTNPSKYECPYIKTYAFCSYPDCNNLPKVTPEPPLQDKPVKTPLQTSRNNPRSKKVSP